MATRSSSGAGVGGAGDDPRADCTDDGPGAGGAGAGEVPPAPGGTSSPAAGRSRLATSALELGAAAVVLGYGVLIVRVVPHVLYVPVNLAAAGAAVAAVRAARVSWRDLGLARDRLWSGVKLGLLTVVPIAAVVAVGLALPWTREFFRDRNIVGASTATALFEGLVRIPFGTALAEELIFRGALLGLYLQRHRPWVAVLMSSAVFGVWHVLPTLGSLRTNPGAAAASGVLSQYGAVGAVVVATGLAGAVFCALRLRSGSVLAPWLTHAALNGVAYGASRIAGYLPS